VVLQDGRLPRGAQPSGSGGPLGSVRSRRRRRSFAVGGSGFFLVRPPHALPVADRRSFALERAARRPLAAPAELLEQPPECGRDDTSPARLLDEDRDAPRGPQARVEAEASGPRLSPCSMRRRLAGAELRLCDRRALSSSARHGRRPRAAAPTDSPDCRWTSSCRRLSASLIPCLRSVAALKPPSFERIENPAASPPDSPCRSYSKSDALVTILREIQ